MVVQSYDFPYDCLIILYHCQICTRFPTIYVGMEDSQSTRIPNQTNKQTNKHKVSNNFEEFLIKILSRSQCATWLIARRRLASKKKHVAAYDSMQRRMPKRAHARMLDFARQFLEFVPPGLPRIRTTNMWCSASKTKVSTTRPNIFRNCICSIFWDIFEIKCPAVFDILL